MLWTKVERLERGTEEALRGEWWVATYREESGRKNMMGEEFPWKEWGVAVDKLSQR